MCQYANVPMPFGSTAQHIGKLVYWHIIKNNFLICNVDYTFISFYFAPLHK